MAVAPKRNKFSIIPDLEEIKAAGAACSGCNECIRACPNNQPIPEAMKAAAEGDLEPFADILDECIGCARCDSACPKDFPLHSFMVKAGEKKLWEEKYMMRSGRGAIQDIEIRNVGGPVVLGEIPGVIAIVGCANYPEGQGAVAEIAEEFARRNYIVVLSGCAAMSVAMTKDEEGKTLYETIPRWI